jgi:hypothetical protein
MIFSRHIYNSQKYFYSIMNTIDEKFNCESEVNIEKKYIKITCYGKIYLDTILNYVTNIFKNNYKSSSLNYFDNTICIYFSNMIV